MRRSSRHNINNWAIVFFIVAACLLVTVLIFRRPKTQTDITTNDAARSENASGEAGSGSTGNVNVARVNSNTSSNLNRSVNLNINASPTNLNINTAPPATVAPSQEISRVPTTDKVAVFTFDAGSGDTSLSKILGILADKKLTGTFFVTGKWVENYPQQLQAIIGDGHEVYNHTYSHPYLTNISDAEIRREFEKTEKLVYDLTGQSTKPYFRPPYGDRNAHVREFAAALGYQDVYWTVDALDWKESEGETSAQVNERVLSNLQPGAIILMHVGDTLTGRVLDDLITEIQSRGYTIKSLTQALG